MNRALQLAAAIVALGGIPAAAQFAVPEIAFDSQAEPLKTPDNITLGEVAGVATNSRGDVFVFTRTGHPMVSLGGARAFAHHGSRLVQFDRTGKFVREIGQGTYGFTYAQQVRVDPQDNIWAVDQFSNMVMKFDPQGRIVLLLGRKAEAETIPARGSAPPAAPPAGGGGAGRGGAPPPAAAAPPPAPGGRPPGSGGEQDLFTRPTDVAWDAAGNIYVADGLGANNRVAKFDKNGKFIKTWGFTGPATGQFQQVHGLAIDAQGNVYVADAGNRRVQVFDGDGNFKRAFINVGRPEAICITPAPRQVLYISNTNLPTDIDSDGEIYKVDLNGKLLGRFGRAGKLMKEFGTTNSIDCRSENELYVGEILNWRVQKLTLRP